MYERFTDRARKVMKFANQEAQRFNDEYVKSEYILIGLVKEESGVAAYVLKELGIELGNIRRETEKVVVGGPDLVTMGFLPKSEDAKAVVMGAIEESKVLGHRHVGTEHLLLGILRDPTSPACKVLAGLGVELDMVRGGIVSLLADAAPKRVANNLIIFKCQLCGAPSNPSSLFDAQDLTDVKTACVACIEKSAFEAGAKAMQRAAEREIWDASRHGDFPFAKIVMDAISAINPAELKGVK